MRGLSPPEARDESHLTIEEKGVSLSKELLNILERRPVEHLTWDGQDECVIDSTVVCRRRGEPASVHKASESVGARIQIFVLALCQPQLCEGLFCMHHARHHVMEETSRLVWEMWEVLS